MTCFPSVSSVVRALPLALLSAFVFECSQNRPERICVLTSKANIDSLPSFNFKGRFHGSLCLPMVASEYRRLITFVNQPMSCKLSLKGTNDTVTVIWDKTNLSRCWVAKKSRSGISIDTVPIERQDMPDKNVRLSSEARIALECVDPVNGTASTLRPVFDLNFGKNGDQIFFRLKDIRIGNLKTILGNYQIAVVRDQGAASFSEKTRVTVYIDKNGDSLFQTSTELDSASGIKWGEGVLSSSPFVLRHRCYRISNIPPDGSSITFESQEDIPTGLSRGLKAPDFSVTTFDNRHLQIGKLHGKIIVINTWAKNCTPCLMEIPELSRLAQKYDTAGVVFLALMASSCGVQDPPAFVKGLDFKYQHALQDSVLRRLFGLAFPRHIVIDAAGYVAADIWGGQPGIEHLLASVIESCKIEGGRNRN